MSSDLVCRAESPAAKAVQVESRVPESYSEMASRVFWETVDSAKEWMGWGSSSKTRPSASKSESVALPGLSVGDSADETDKVTIDKNSTTYRAYERAKAGTVQLTDSGGSGFFVDKEGTVVTASHAVPYGTFTTRIRTADGQDLDAVFISRDSKNDLAVLKVVSKGQSDLPFLNVDAQDAYGERLAAIGHPKRWPSVYLSLGKASKGPVDPNYDLWRKSDAVIGLDAHVEPGNSGGAVIDGCGSVRAVTVGQRGDAITYAIPSKAVQQLLRWTNDAASGRIYYQEGLSLASVERPEPIGKGFPTDFGNPPQLPAAKLEPSPYNGPIYQSPYGRIYKGAKPAPPGGLGNPYGDGNNYYKWQNKRN